MRRLALDIKLRHEGATMYRDAGTRATVRWEYKTVLVKTNATSVREINDMLNGNGSEGWELVSMAPANLAQMLFVLKRASD